MTCLSVVDLHLIGQTGRAGDDLFSQHFLTTIFFFIGLFVVVHAVEASGVLGLGRAKIIQTARNFGIYTPLPDTPSLPIGVDEVNVLEHAVAYATFPNLGKAVTPHAVLEVRTGTGELVWRFDRDGKRPQQVISPRVALEMIAMMNSVVENGTGRRAQLDGLKVAGKTGTTNGFRDAWFVGYTGNFVGAVWMGNDDYSPTKRMTGGTIPA